MDARIRPSAARLLTHEMRSLLVRLLELMQEHIRRVGIPVSRTEVMARVDPEEGTEKLVITQWVRLSTEAAMDYWDRLSEDIEEWINSLPESSAESVCDWVALDVYSDVDDAAA